ncbi:hypothetical protein D3C79_670410 [compost metagenome]
MATDIEIIDDLAGAPLDHQVDALRPEWLRHELTPAVHATKQRPFADPALLEPVGQRRHRAILFARDECNFGLVQLMLARLETKPYPLPHEIEIAHLDTGGFRTAQGTAEHQQQQGVIPQSRQI